MKIILISGLTAFFVTLGLSLLLLPLLKRLKAGQPILHYVEEHKTKAGTPTMGGTIFIIGTAVSCAFLFGENNKIALVALAVTVGYAVIGFLDDYIKIHYKRNLGLKAYQKIIAQLSVATIVALYAYNNQHIGSNLIVPFTDITVNIQWFFVPLIVFVFVACTNGVNLTDGLDGLAASTTIVFLIVSITIINFLSLSAQNSGDTIKSAELTNLAIFSAALCGSLLVFLTINGFPAKVFMGDTGSLGLGAAVACVSVFSQNTLLIPVLGIMFVVSCISVIIQVLHFKRTKKRVFLMAPLHHHFQMKGHHENKIVIAYSTITLIIGCVAILFMTM